MITDHQGYSAHKKSENENLQSIFKKAWQNPFQSLGRLWEGTKGYGTEKTVRFLKSSTREKVEDLGGLTPYIALTFTGIGEAAAMLRAKRSIQELKLGVTLFQSSSLEGRSVVQSVAAIEKNFLRSAELSVAGLSPVYEIEYARNLFGLETVRTPSFLELEGLPFGFADREQFAKFGEAIKSGIDSAGHKDAKVYFRGSSITGKCENIRKKAYGQPFSLERGSDYDLAIASKSLFEKAKSMKIPLTGNGRRTVPLDSRLIKKIGLENLRDNLQSQTQYPISLMLYDSPKSIQQRGSHLLVP